MCKNFLRTICLVLLAGVVLFVTAGPVGAVTGDDYYKIVANLKKGDKNVDFTALRMTYSQTKDFNPNFSSSADPKMKKALELIEKKDYKQAIEIANKILDENYTYAEAHMIMAYAYRQMGDEEKAKFHRYVFGGIIKSIVKSGDGLSPKTAMKVISVQEEYVVFRATGLKVLKQSLITDKEGHFFDEMKVQHIKSGKSMTLYFNVDIPIRATQAILKK